MTGHTPAPVTVVGLGAMGRALAEAFIGAGHPTTVWNRTAGKAEPLVARGAVHSLDIADAVAASPLIVACLTTYDATSEALEPAGGALAGRTLITLNSGSPGQARQMADWAAGRGARFLDGAVKNVPEAVGKPDTLLYYSGDRATFDDHEKTLRVLGGDTVHLGTEPDLAALYETAVGGMLLPALVGFFQGTALVTARGLEAASLVRYSVKWLEMIASLLPALAAEVDAGDYANPSSSIGLFHEFIGQEREFWAASGVDVSWHAPLNELVNRAVAEGHRDHSLSALVEVLRKPGPAA
ncbi:NAD(P)-dependent oxidoreductase [Streptomyces litchfieldiae]|uniref:NAD(P)-binding domain-containing protein n=1 Tax=Streptomyces litchfieldiae TaxID=3075543 RepID=A0ABU2MWT3_9ACTN|nr:NAD(P)-binding domain-containing protein [Streptomyces sp. DSM 44938]MDT0345748.1 NAD(P)-binding domain-containing protein [Streptomyces sp. DSM 44938]